TASVSPPRSRLLQVMPPERSQNFVAAAQHGVNSPRSMAPAAVPDSPRTTNATASFFIECSPRLFGGSALLTSLRAAHQMSFFESVTHYFTDIYGLMRLWSAVVVHCLWVLIGVF